MTRLKRLNLAATGTLLLVLSCTFPGSVQGFGARLTRLWERESSCTSALAPSLLHPYPTSSNDRHKHPRKHTGVDILFLVRRPECSFYTTGNSITAMRTKSSNSDSNDDDDEVVPPATDATPAHASSVRSSADGASSIVSSAAVNAPSSTLQSTSTSTSSVWSWHNMGPLFQLVRPANFPGIVLFHMVGVYLALLSGVQKSTSTVSSSISGAVGMNWTLYWNILLKEPSMWLVLAALLLTSSTSMVVNDYYDAKLGRDDVHTAVANGDDNINGDGDGGDNINVNQMLISHPLAQGRVSLRTARRFLSYLYGTALVTLACLPGVHVRLSVVLGLVLTYFYTQSLKPVTWVKNVVCASLIALSPLTSGMAALTVLQQKSGHVHTTPVAAVTGMILPRLWRLTATLFFGILGREIMMDCNDVVSDGRANVLTVPVVHGRRFASKIAFGTTVIMAGLTVGLELLEIVTTTVPGINGVLLLNSIPRQAARRLALAGVASALTLRRSWQVYRTQGSDPKAVDKAVNESLVTVAILLASFI